jgi:hypothetical protein
MERFATPFTNDLYLALSRLVGAFVRTELPVPHGRIVPEHLATGDALCCRHRLAISDSVPGKPVTDRRFRNTTVISNVLLITAAFDVLLT